MYSIITHLGWYELPALTAKNKFIPYIFASSFPKIEIFNDLFFEKSFLISEAIYSLVAIFGGVICKFLAPFIASEIVESLLTKSL